MRRHRLLATLLVTGLLSACTTTSTSSQATTTTAASAGQRVVTDAAKARIDSALRAYVASGRVAGASALVWEKGREVYFGAFGMADREANRPMTRDVIAQIFSMTKPITGVALMQLYVHGKFKLDDPLAKYLPEFTNVRVYAGGDSSAPTFEAPSRPITVADITRHTAGFVVGSDAGHKVLGPLFRAANPQDRNNTISQYAERLATVPLAFQPGTRWSYGISVDVQAALVERLAGQPFQDYVKQHVLDPLGMRETRWYVPESDRSRFAAIYQRSAEGALRHSPDSVAKAYNTNHWALFTGASGLTSTLDDYLRFARMLLNGGELDGVRILRPETIRLMATNHLPATVRDSSFLTSKGQVGFGIDFAVRVAPPKSAEENNGTVGEFFWDGAASTLFWVDPANQLTAVMFTQVMPFDARLHKVFRDAVYGSITLPPR